MKEAATTTLVMLALVFCTQSFFQSAYASTSSSAAVAAAAAARRTTTSSSDSPDGLTCGQTRVLYNDNACCSSNLGAKTCTRSVAKGRWDQIASNLTEKLAAVSNDFNQRLTANDASHRNWTKTKLNGYVASTAAQFRLVREKMAKNKNETDLALKQASQRLTLANNALNVSCVSGLDSIQRNASAEVQTHAATVKTDCRNRADGFVSAVSESVSKVCTHANTVCTDTKSAAAALSTALDAEKQNVLILTARIQAAERRIKLLEGGSS